MGYHILGLTMLDIKEDLTKAAEEELEPARLYFLSKQQLFPNVTVIKECRDS